MRYAFNYLLAALLLLLLLYCSCSKDLPAPSEGPSRIVLLGELIAGDSMHIRAGRSKPFSSGTYTEPEFERDMQISCGTAGSIQALTAYEDDLLHSVYTTLFSNPDIVREQREYRVKAAKPGLESVEAVVQIPAAFNGTVGAAGVQIRNGDSVYAFDISMSALPPGSQYVIEVLRTPVSIYTTFIFDGNGYILEENRALYDSLIRAGATVDVFTDTAYSPLIDRQAFFADRSSAENTDPATPRSYYWFFIKPAGQPNTSLRLFVSVAALRQGLTPHSELIIRLKSVAGDYYAFLKSYELGHLQPPGQGLSLKGTTATGNVTGGIGIVGGVFQHEARFLH